jgi:aerobic carbon-monoxide dehydrogenase medium subunit
LKPPPFEYHVPTSAEEAVGLLSDLGEDAKFLAGGQSLIPMLALRLTAFDHLIDIGRIDELKGVERREGALWLGAGTTEAAVGSDRSVAEAAPLLARATPLIGHFQIRNRGTIGGSVAHADPAAEYPAVALTLDATMEALSPRGRRTIAAVDFFEGLWTTSLEPDELLVGLTFSDWSGRCGFAIEEMARRHGDFAVAGAAIALEIDTDDRLTRCGIGLIGLGSTPIRARGAEEEVLGNSARDVDAGEVGRIAMTGLSSIPSDLHGSENYRRRLGAVMVERAWTTALEEALGA